MAKPKAAGLQFYPGLRLMYAIVPEDDLQIPFEMLLGVANLEGPENMLSVDCFLSTTERLVEKYCPDFKAGLEWDNRHKEEKEHED